MSHVKNAAVCLLDDKVTFDDIGPESGLVDAYFYDMDRPFLDNHMFLMYDPESKKDKAGYAISHMKTIDSFYNSRVIRVDGKHYYVYAYTLNPAQKKMKNGIFDCSDSQKKRIIKFWDPGDLILIHDILSGTSVLDKDDSVLPLDDGDFWQQDVERDFEQKIAA